MPGGLSRKRRAKAINVTGLSESKEAFEAGRRFQYCLGQGPDQVRQGHGDP